MKCKVMRPFGGPDNATLDVGSVIDIDAWPPRNVKSLIDRRYLLPVETEPLTATDLHEVLHKRPRTADVKPAAAKE